MWHDSVVSMTCWNTERLGDATLPLGSDTYRGIKIKCVQWFNRPDEEIQPRTLQPLVCPASACTQWGFCASFISLKHDRWLGARQTNLSQPLSHKSYKDAPTNQNLHCGTFTEGILGLFKCDWCTVDRVKAYETNYYTVTAKPKSAESKANPPYVT